jgi:hypothetical protein
MFIVVAPWSAWVGIVRRSSPGHVVYLETLEMRICARGRHGGGKRSEARDSPATLATPNPELHEYNSLLTMSIAHGIKTLGVIGAGQMGMFSSFAILSTSLPVVQGSVLPMWPH